MPSSVPALVPVPAPPVLPTETPSHNPTEAPSLPPTKSPTEIPTHYPTERPTHNPTFRSTITPTDVPTAVPTDSPLTIRENGFTLPPTALPTFDSTELPTLSPTATPTIAPTGCHMGCVLGPPPAPVVPICNTFANGSGAGLGFNGRLLGCNVATSDTGCALYVQANEPTANGATYALSNSCCFATFGMTELSPNSNFRSCLFSAGTSPRAPSLVSLRTASGRSSGLREYP